LAIYSYSVNAGSPLDETLANFRFPMRLWWSKRQTGLREENIFGIPHVAVSGS
jgi:hypothetical protein